ncbi:CheR family methyltransferase [Algihabitans albus]|uniref:CheR family methyltransferase n=1 Tax=Algihabitans albus TaxID=2164067 RepID=UPI000E5CC025|nr:protein-glutamate O-methyltransferase CheR [Algihabitans albus]
MNKSDFDFLATLLRNRSGLVLSDEKAYLLESRLGPVARKHGLTSVEDVASQLRARPGSPLELDVVEAMTTNESFFFRDTRPFDQFKDIVLPQLLDARRSSRSLRIWSAACSSGQEPYTLAMILKEQAAKLAGWRVEIVATDLSTVILDKAKEGIYSQFEVQRGLPINLLMKYFTQVGDRWQITQDLRGMIDYRMFNLLESPASLGRFDIVFLRNVLIYFDQPTKTQVLERVAKQMPSDGYLYLGGAETVLGITDRFQVLPGQRGLYGVVDPAAKVAAAG